MNLNTNSYHKINDPVALKKKKKPDILLPDKKETYGLKKTKNGIKNKT